MTRETLCDGVMIGRAALTNPWIFPQSAVLLAGRPYTLPTVAARHRLMRDHFAEVLHREDERTALHKLRKFTGWYTHGLQDGRFLRRQLSELPTAARRDGGRGRVLRRSGGRLMRARLPMPLTRDLHVHTSDVPVEVFGDEFRAACERLDRFVGALVRRMGRDLGLEGVACQACPS